MFRHPFSHWPGESPRECEVDAFNVRVPETREEVIRFAYW